MSMKKIYVIHGPNLNLLGSREPEIYGKTTLKEILHMLRKNAREKRIKLGVFQSNHEGKLIDRIQSLPRKGYSGLIINPGALTHYSYALRDAIKASGLMAVEVHISDIENREDFRKISVVKDVCIEQIKGMGPAGYGKALDLLLDRLPP